MIIDKLKEKKRFLHFRNRYKKLDRSVGKCPMIFISQLSRSGGSMLSQLFDNVPGIKAFPKEIKFCSRKYFIQDLDELCGWKPEAVRSEFAKYNVIFKDGRRGTYGKGTINRVPFVFEEDYFNYSFDRQWNESPPKVGREIMEIFFNSFFSAWKVSQKHDFLSPKYITAFASWTAMREENMARYFDYYPDGYLIQILREPIGWYQSVKGKVINRNRGSKAEIYPIYRDINSAIKCYKKQFELLEKYRHKYNGRTLTLDYDLLVNERSSLLKNVCEFFNIDFSENIKEATFGGLKIGMNTSYNASAAVRRHEILDHSEKYLLNKHLSPLYRDRRELSNFV